MKLKSAHDTVEDKQLAKEDFKPEVKNEDDHKWFSKRIDGDVELGDTDDLAAWMRYDFIWFIVLGRILGLEIFDSLPGNFEPYQTVGNILLC